jgi:hypothetical protein
LVRQNLKLTYEQRVVKHQQARRAAEELKRAGLRMRAGAASAR